MKYLKIEENKGWFWDGSKYQEIDKINKDGLLILLNTAEKDDFELDPYEEKILGNKAHQVIYQNIYSKLEQFLNDKDQFKTEVDKLYKEAMSKYSVKAKDENIDEYKDPESEEDSEVSIEDIPF